MQLSALLSTLSPYRDRRIASIFILGIAQGIPWVMIGSMLTLWLKEAGISRTEIGLTALIFTVYAINFLWSPLVEMLRPNLIPKLGQRQSWILFCQLIILSCCFLISVYDSAVSPQNIVVLCLIIATLSATQDIAIDAYRVDCFSQDETDKVSAAAGTITAGWWTGYAGLGAIPLILSDMQWTWPELYRLLGLIMLALALCTIFLPAPKFSHSKARNKKFEELSRVVNRFDNSKKLQIIAGIIAFTLIPIAVILQKLDLVEFFSQDKHLYISALLMTMALLFFIAHQLKTIKATDSKLSQSSPVDTLLVWLLTALVEPLREFFTRNGVKLAISLLGFIVLFKLGEAFLGRMSLVFYKEVGFSNSQIATYSKLLTWWLTVFFSILGGIVNAKFGLLKGLFISAIAMASTNLLFALLAIVGPSEKLYALTIVLDGFAAAWSTVAFVAFISLLCNHAFSATQYALLASLSNLGRTTLSASSGQVVDWLNGNWAIFFLVTTLMVVPSLVILWNIRAYIFELMKKE